MGISSLASGGILYRLGWNALNYTAVPLLLASTTLVIISLPAVARRAAVRTADAVPTIIESAMLKLSILDQSPIISGQTPAAAIHATLELAQAGAARLSPLLAGRASSHARPGRPDARNPARSGRGRPSASEVGSGGVMLPYYSPFKVAEISACRGAVPGPHRPRHRPRAGSDQLTGRGR